MTTFAPTLAQAPATASASTGGQKAAYYYKLFRVRRSDGRVTTVSVNPVLVAQACQKMGGLQAVGQTVRTAALTYEDGAGKNCSNFVSQALREAMSQATAARQAANLAASAMQLN